MTTATHTDTHTQTTHRYRATLDQYLADSFDFATPAATIYTNTFNTAAKLADDLGAAAAPILRTIATEHHTRYIGSVSRNSSTRDMLYHGHTSRAYAEAAEILATLTN